MSDGAQNYSRARDVSAGLTPDMAAKRPNVPEAPSSPPATAQVTTPARERKIFDNPDGDSPSADGESAAESPSDSPKSAKNRPASPSSDAPQAPNSKGQIVNTAIQALGAAAGNLGGGAAAAGGQAAAGAAESAATSAAEEVAESAARNAGTKATQSNSEVARKMARDNVKRGAKDAATSAAKDKGGDSWASLGKDARGAVKDAATSGSTLNPVNDDDRTRTTKARDNLKERTGIDADQAVGAVVGGAAAAATAATGVGVPLSAAAGAVGQAIGTGVSRGLHTVTTKINSMRKTSLVAVGTILVLLTLSGTGLLTAAAQSQKQQDEQAAAFAQMQALQQTAEVASTGCADQQQYPLGYRYTYDQTKVAKAINAVGQERDLSDYAVVIATAAALVRSGLDATSSSSTAAGIFMFPTGKDTGTAEQLADPSYSAGLFFDRLVKIKSWQAQPLDQAANTVLGLAYVGSFGPFESAARVALNQAGADVGMGCQPLGTPLACDPIPSFETDTTVLTPDARNLARCLWQLQLVRDITASSGGYVLTFDAPGTVNVAKALKDPGDASAKSSKLSGQTVMAWLAAVYETFGISTVRVADQEVTFDASARVTDPDASVYTVNSLPAGSTEAGVIQVRVFGTAGTGVISAGSGAWVLPVQGACVTSKYGMRFHPVLHEWRLHAGTDFGVPIGTPVSVVSSGVVKASFFSSTGGNMMTIDHGNGIVTNYLHLSKPIAKVGQTVQTGEIIALSGNTGRYTVGPHLHFEVMRNGSYTDSWLFLEGQGLTVKGCSGVSHP